MVRLKWYLVMITMFSFATACRQDAKTPAADKDNGGLILPGNFEALVVIDSIGRARHLAVNDNGDIYVKLTYNDAMDGGGGTVGLRDLDNDGRADSVVYFGDYKDVGGSAVGMSIHNGYLYTSTVNQVLRTKLTDGDLVPKSKTEVVLTDTDPNVVKNWHTTKPVAFDNKGYMYIPFGSPSDAGQDITKFGPVGVPGGKGLDPSPERENHAGVWRFKADKINQTQKDGKKFATGIRSVVGMQFNPADESVYAVVNGIDNFHTIYPNLYSSWQAAVLPAETMIKLKEGGDYGWPYAYFDQLVNKNVLQPGYGGDGKITARADTFDMPVIGFPGHWAPMDVLFYNGDMFPERYKKGAFVAFHGSTDRSPYPQAGYIVCFIPLNNGVSDGTIEVFADGFTGVDTVINTSDAVYRPMGLSVGPDGSLYISESNKGKIWRVMYKGDKNKFGEAQLAEMEKRKTTRTYIKTPDEKADNLNTGDRLEGSILFDSYCASCHQRNGKGDNNRFPPIAGSQYVTGDKTRLIDIILNGLQGPITVNGKTYNGFMPPHKDILDDHAIASISTYIRSRFGNKASGVYTTEVTKVRNGGKLPVDSSETSSQKKSSDQIVVKKCNDFTIDGKGSNAEWNKTEWQAFTKITKGGTDHETKSKILYSSRGIYVLFSGKDQKITTKNYKDYDDEIYEGDVFEVFFHPQPGMPQYFEFEVNHLNKELTLTLTRSKGNTTAWTPWNLEYAKRPQIKKKVNIVGGKPEIGSAIQSWTAEVFFPNEIFKLLPGIPPQSGDIWNANFCRIDYDDGKAAEWSWSPEIISSFHELEHFRSIKFE